MFANPQRLVWVKSTGETPAEFAALKAFFEREGHIVVAAFDDVPEALAAVDRGADATAIVACGINADAADQAVSQLILHRAADGRQIPFLIVSPAAIESVLEGVERRPDGLTDEQWAVVQGIRAAQAELDAAG